MQEDIIGLTDSSYNLVCSYEYDSWGKLISIKDNSNNIITDTSHIGYINPFRYRSYYYDNETKLYYLNSRYYNPEWGRFVNADSIIKAEENKYNLYMYCKDNPIKYIDANGNFALLGTLIGSALIGVGLTGLTYLAVQGLANIAGAVYEDIITHKPYKSKNNKNDKKGKKEYYVYGLVDPTKKGSDNKPKVEYVVRTNNIERRRQEHKVKAYEKDLIMYVEMGNLTYSESRKVEEALILKYSIINGYKKVILYYKTKHM